MVAPFATKTRGDAMKGYIVFVMLYAFAFTRVCVGESLIDILLWNEKVGIFGRELVNWIFIAGFYNGCMLACAFAYASYLIKKDPQKIEAG